MKKGKKLIGGFLAILMLTQFTLVNAATKTEEIVESLRKSAESYDGIVNYENDTIEIEWYAQNSKSSEISYSHNNNIIEYNPGEITTYEEAEDFTSHLWYSLYLIESALRVNGYSEEAIENFFVNDEIELDYETYGIEFKELGEEKKFTSPDGTITTTVTPMSIKIDLAKANLDGEPSSRTTTIEDIVEYLQSNSEFRSTEDEGKIVAENEITSDDETVTIYHTYYWEEYHEVEFSSEDDIITYEDYEMESYYDAERSLSHQIYAAQILMIALQMNGYTADQIQEFFANEENDVDYERNGIELKELGEAKEYISSDGTTTITTSPVSIKIDLTKANLNKTSNEEDDEYKVLEGDKQTVDISKNEELTFRFNIEYSKFMEDGKVYIDGKLVDSSNYTVKEGSTIITFKNDFVKTLSAKEHTLKVTVADGEVETTFTIATTNAVKNPNTGDNIMFYISLLGLSVTSLVGARIYQKKNLFNK